MYRSRRTINTINSCQHIWKHLTKCAAEKIITMLLHYTQSNLNPKAKQLFQLNPQNSIICLFFPLTNPWIPASWNSSTYYRLVQATRRAKGEWEEGPPQFSLWTRLTHFWESASSLLQTTTTPLVIARLSFYFLYGTELTPSSSHNMTDNMAWGATNKKHDKLYHTIGVKKKEKPQDRALRHSTWSDNLN